MSPPLLLPDVTCLPWNLLAITVPRRCHILHSAPAQFIEISKGITVQEARTTLPSDFSRSVRGKPGSCQRRREVAVGTSSRPVTGASVLPTPGARFSVCVKC